jgi:hypothetical protein
LVWEFDIERDEIDGVILEDTKSLMAIVYTVEIVKRPEDNLERVAGPDLVLDNQNGGFKRMRWHIGSM